ncbi:hypothetical protein Hanom_Chr03g00204921 [Helianthus anomalus]
MSKLRLFMVSISVYALSGFTYSDWHPITRPVIGASVATSTPHLGAKVSANSESAGFFDLPTSSQFP